MKGMADSMKDSNYPQADSDRFGRLESGRSARSAGCAQLPDSSTVGTVWLVGAGCHDRRWLTVQALELLARCDALVYDDLIDPAILDLAPQARKFYRGKRGSRPSADQDEIHALLADLASQYSIVVRLKGGDPMIFGRGLEEIEQLRARQIPVRLVPGISSISGIPAKELFGLTRRDEAAQFMVLSARKARNKRTAEDWKQIAAFQGTLVFLMGMSMIAEIADHLIEGGMDPETPAAILCSPAMTLTQSVKAPLHALAQKAAALHLKSPGLILVGGSVRSYQPLQTIRIGLAASDAFSERLQQLLPAEFQSVPILRLRYTDRPVDLRLLESHPDAWLVFTSPHGAKQFLLSLKADRYDLRRLAGNRIACIGRSTAREFELSGIQPDLTAPDQNSESLLDSLRSRLAEDSTVLLFQSDKALPVLREGLRADCSVQEQRLYDFVCEPACRIDTDYTILPSAAAARAWLAMPDRPHCDCLIVLSERIKEILTETSHWKTDAMPRIVISLKPDAQSVVDCLYRDLNRHAVKRAETSPSVG